ncbi:MAG: c-type cytochrome [Alphaproteobacteria bacterium]|nr:c-type cytochrome [Alphaproteobacteria bacterium]MBU6472756.1 c-type cytochrome [Alphaproteobacteria bacterium]MDE2013399.1 cytochrome c [Alphaproteobacteria bacterium]MDE2074446.1 cytochrome c [Alphaproteobacteria bacterium]MDE2350899.1 cytochrome c [Alphaproteobacteria bacterium]
MTQSLTKPILWAVVLAAWMAGATSAVAQAAGEWKDSAEIWKASCHYCHDEGVGPQILGLHLAPELIRQTVRNGLNAMPPFFPSELDARELAALAHWVSVHGVPPAKEKQP